MHAPGGQGPSLVYSQLQWFKHNGSLFLSYAKSELLWWLCDVVMWTGSLYLVALPSLALIHKTEMAPRHVYLPTSRKWGKEEEREAPPFKGTTQKLQASLGLLSHGLKLSPLATGTRTAEKWSHYSALLGAPLKISQFYLKGKMDIGTQITVSSIASRMKIIGINRFENMKTMSAWFVPATSLSSFPKSSHSLFTTTLTA